MRWGWRVKRFGRENTVEGTFRVGRGTPWVLRDSPKWVMRKLRQPAEGNNFEKLGNETKEIHRIIGPGESEA